MKIKQILLIMLLFELSHCRTYADGLTNNPNLRIVRHGSYTYTWMVTNHVLIYVNPNEFWPGTWKEDTNGWRVQLCVYPQINNRFKDGVAYPLSTNLMLSVEWGSNVKNSGSGYYRSPNGKFAKFELLNAKGNVISPNPNAGENLLLNLIGGENLGGSFSQKLEYGINLPAWVAPLNGSLVANFPKTISINAYPYVEYGVLGKIGHNIMGEIGSTTNLPPFPVGLLKLDEIYSVTNAGEYTLTVQPVLYKRRSRNSEFLDRVDLPSVTTKVHLVPNAK